MNMTPAETAALRANLLANPVAKELAAEGGMTLEQYVDATLAFCENPSAGFAGAGLQGPDSEQSEDSILSHATMFEAAPHAPVVNLGAGEVLKSAPLREGAPAAFKARGIIG